MIHAWRVIDPDERVSGAGRNIQSVKRFFIAVREKNPAAPGHGRPVVIAAARFYRIVVRQDFPYIRVRLSIAVARKDILRMVDQNERRSSGRGFRIYKTVACDLFVFTGGKRVRRKLVFISCSFFCE